VLVDFDSLTSPVDQGGIPSGEIGLDVLFDLPSHVRLSINDDEIVDRALSVQILSGKDVAFLTYDPIRRSAPATRVSHTSSTCGASRMPSRTSKQ